MSCGVALARLYAAWQRQSEAPEGDRRPPLPVGEAQAACPPLDLAEVEALLRPHVAAELLCQHTEGGRMQENGERSLVAEPATRAGIDSIHDRPLLRRKAIHRKCW